MYDDIEPLGFCCWCGCLVFAVNSWSLRPKPPRPRQLRPVPWNAKRELRRRRMTPLQRSSLLRRRLHPRQQLHWNGKRRTWKMKTMPWRRRRLRPVRRRKQANPPPRWCRLRIPVGMRRRSIPAAIPTTPLSTPFGRREKSKCLCCRFFIYLFHLSFLLMIQVVYLIEHRIWRWPKHLNLWRPNLHGKQLHFEEAVSVKTTCDKELIIRHGSIRSIDWLIDWCVAYFDIWIFRSIDWSIDLMIDIGVQWIVDRLIDWLECSATMIWGSNFHSLIDWLNIRFSCKNCDWSICFVHGSSLSWLLDWLVYSY